MPKEREKKTKTWEGIAASRKVELSRKLRWHYKSDVVMREPFCLRGRIRTGVCYLLLKPGLGVIVFLRRR